MGRGTLRMRDDQERGYDVRRKDKKKHLETDGHRPGQEQRNILLARRRGLRGRLQTQSKGRDGQWDGNEIDASVWLDARPAKVLGQEQRSAGSLASKLQGQITVLQTDGAGLGGV